MTAYALGMVATWAFIFTLLRSRDLTPEDLDELHGVPEGTSVMALGVAGLLWPVTVAVWLATLRGQQ